MALIIFIAAIIQLALLIYFFATLAKIDKSTNGNFLLNLFTKFHQDEILKSVNQILETPVGYESVVNLASNQIQDLNYYLDFLEFVVAMEGKEIKPSEFRYLFGKQFSHLQRHQNIYTKFIEKKRQNIENYLRMNYSQAHDKDTDVFVP